MGYVPRKRAFYKSGAVRVALVYLAACAFAFAWSEMHAAPCVLEAWHWWRPTPAPTLEQWRDPMLVNQARAMDQASILEYFRSAYCIDLLITGYRAALIALPFLAALGALVRTVARASMRAGHADPFAGVRAFAKQHAVLTCASPGLMWLAYAVARYVRHNPNTLDLSVHLVSFAVAAVPVFLAHLLLTRLTLPALLAPTLSEQDQSEKIIVADEFDFAAVAVTREALLAVKGVAAFTVAMVVLLMALPTVDGLPIQLSVALYVPLAIVAAVYFRRASRIQVGLDGIHVHGTSSSRFIAFHELDGVRSRGAEIELVRGSATVLRLQLHGPDAVRREPLTKRIAAATLKAAEERDQPVTRFVNGATREDLSRAAEGASSYRHAAVSRDQLWAAVEGPAVASGARIAAAKALATSTDAAERARFRIAADHCADPSARAELVDLLEDDEARDRAPARTARLAIP